MEKGNIFYTYILCDPRKKDSFKIPTLDIVLDAEPFYVGMGHNNRHKDHVKRTKLAIKRNNKYYFNEGNKMKNRIIRDLLKDDLLPIIKLVVKNTNRQEAAMSECFLIKSIGRLDRKTGCLTNLTDGGETGTHDRKVSKWEPFEITTVDRSKWANGFSVIQYCPFSDTYKRFETIRDIIGWDAPNYDRITIGNVCRGLYLQFKGLIYFWEKDFTPANLEIRLNNFFSQNPPRLKVAKKEYIKRCLEKEFEERERMEMGNESKSYELKLSA